MSGWTSFTDKEINSIKINLNQKFDRAMIFILLFTPLICLIAPYIPSRKRKRMIDRMDYNDAVLQFAIFWILVIIGVWIWNNYNSKKQFLKHRKFLRKKKLIALVKEKKKSIFKSYKNNLITNLEGSLKKIRIAKEQSNNLKIGDEIRIEIEEHTETVLTIEN